VDGERRQLVEADLAAVEMQQRERRPSGDGLDEAAGVWQLEPRQRLRGERLAGRRLGRDEEPVRARVQRRIRVARHRPGDRLERALDRGRRRAQVVAQPVAGELLRDRQRREDGVEHRRVVVPPADDEAHRLELAAQRAAAGVELAHARPVRRGPDGVLDALLGAARRAGVGDPAPPVLDAVDAARHDLDEVEVEPPVEAEHRLRETLGRVVDVGRVAPERDGWTIDRLPSEGGDDALALRHAGSLPPPSRGERVSGTAPRA